MIEGVGDRSRRGVAQVNRAIDYVYRLLGSLEVDSQTVRGLNMHGCKVRGFGVTYITVRGRCCVGLGGRKG